MPKFFPQVFITGIVLILLLGAGYGISQAARAIPWDCTDWQAFAHSDRTTSILESLAANRGKTLYCGIDQSDTFTKPKLGRPAATATSGTAPSIRASRAVSAALSPPRRAG